MLDLHCHILPGVDDGATDDVMAIEMARRLVAAGFERIAASPHFGTGPGGDVSRATAADVRAALNARLVEEGLSLVILPNAEHHVSAELMTRIDADDVVPIGGAGKWLLVELPWQAMVKIEEVLFRIQARGYKLLLAHPERYTYVEFDLLERLSQRGVLLQLELGSFLKTYGRRARKMARALAKAGLAHVVATDLHRPDDWLGDGLDELSRRYGAQAVERATLHNPQALLDDAPVDAVRAFTE